LKNAITEIQLNQLNQALLMPLHMRRCLLLCMLPLPLVLWLLLPLSSQLLLLLMFLTSICCSCCHSQRPRQVASFQVRAQQHVVCAWPWRQPCCSH
jgi:hypothetical protein